MLSYENVIKLVFKRANGSCIPYSIRVHIFWMNALSLYLHYSLGVGLKRVKESWSIIVSLL